MITKIAIYDGVSYGLFECDSENMKRKISNGNEKCPQFYKIGDKVEAIQLNTGAWCSADIIDIFPKQNCECYGKCHCKFLILFESDDNKVQIAERNLDEIRQVTYSSLDWDSLKKGMKVVINYNIKNPGQWGHWYDYIINDIRKRDDITYVKGTLMVGYHGVTDKIPVEINSDNVLDVLEIRPHATVEEKELDTYESGVKPEFCKSCKNKPKAKCKKCCCCKCGSKKDFELTVQCDECADWYHTYCLVPPLAALPDDEDWYCPKCSNENLRAKKEAKRKSKIQLKKKRGLKKGRRKKFDDSEVIADKERKSSPEKAKQPQEDTKQEGGDGMMKMRFISKIPKSSSVWDHVVQMYPEYEVRRISVELVDKNENNKEVILNSTLERLIYADEVNEQLWNEARGSIKDGKQAFLSHVRRLFTCSICCELMREPITLSCKHSFCITCFFKALSVNVYNCALCRTDVIHTEHYLVNENLAKILELLFRK